MRTAEPPRKTLQFKANQKVESFVRQEAKKRKRTLSNLIEIWIEMIADGEMRPVESERDEAG